MFQAASAEPLGPRSKIRKGDHHIWWCGTALWGCLLVGVGVGGASWRLNEPEECQFCALGGVRHTERGKAGSSILSHNGLLLIAAREGPKFITLCVGGDFWSVETYKCNHTRAFTLRGGAPRGARKVESCGKSTDTIPLQEAPESAVLNRKLKPLFRC